MIKKSLLILALLVLAAVLGFKFWAPALATFLIYESHLEKADLIHVFYDGAFDRSSHAAKLFHQGWAEEVLVTGGYIPQTSRALGLMMCEAEINARLLVRTGVPSEAISIERVGESTYEELVFLHTLAERRGLRSIILVSSPYHMRRIYYTSRHIFKDTSVRLIYSSAECNWFNGRRWWADERSFLSVHNEYLKHLYYFFAYFL